MRVTRADWAASCPAKGITGLSAYLTEYTPSGSDSSLLARLEALEKAIAGLGGGEAAPAETLAVNETTAEVVIGTIEPFQAITDIVFVAGLKAGQWVGITPAADYQWLTAYGYCYQDNTVRVIIQNVGDATKTLATASIKVTYLTNG